MATAKSSKKGSTQKKTGTAPSKSFGNFIVLGGQKLALEKHPTDFTVLGKTAAVGSSDSRGAQRLSGRMTRMTAAEAAKTNRLMSAARADAVAHHVYQVADTDEEIVIDDRILLELDHEDERELEQIIRELHLVPEGRMGNAHVLRVTEATGKNPLKAANEIAEREAVTACCPQVMVEIEYHQQPALFAEQWYLTADLISHPDLLSDADIQAPEAWQITTGRPEIVLAVIDDGFDLAHPALQGVAIHPGARDFEGGDNDPNSEDRFVNGVNDGDYHGTPVASIAVGTHGAGSAMRGIAPNCTFLPIRIGFGPLAAPIDILDVFRYASARADVVNCSFGTPPSSFDRLGSNFRREITRLTETGGRRGKGLVMVFSAANDDAPTFLRGSDNVNGVKFTSGGGISEISAGRTVFSGYPMTEGVVAVSAMSSLKRKAGYSSWGPHVAVTAPSNNLHYIQAFVRPGSDPRRSQFVANYRGLGQVAAANRPGHGSPFSPIRRFDDPSTANLRENFYTKEFGGTSGAAPVVTAVAALVLSVNPTLTAAQVRQILMATADQNLDPTLDLAADPNVQGLTGDFAGGRSLWFGAGKVNALRAVRRSQALPGGIPTPDPGRTGGPIRGEARPNLAIPDDRPVGISSGIDIQASGALAGITVTVDISHTWRGDLRVLLVAPSGFVAELHRFAGGSADDLKRSFTPSDTPDLENMVDAGIDVGGTWFLAVADFVRRDVGTLNAWSLELRT